MDLISDALDFILDTLDFILEALDVILEALGGILGMAWVVGWPGDPRMSQIALRLEREHCRFRLDFGFRHDVGRISDSAEFRLDFGFRPDFGFGRISD